MFGLIFFDLYKNRKINQYNKLFETKQNEIKEIENLFSKYYHSNEKFLFNKKKTTEIKTIKRNYQFKKFDTNLYFSKVIGKSTAYLDIYKDYLILGSATGLFLKLIFRDLNKTLTPIKLNTNISIYFNKKEFYLKSHHGIKDILIDGENLFVSYSNEVSENCFNTGILKSKINEKNLLFEKFLIIKSVYQKKHQNIKHLKWDKQVVE